MAVLSELANPMPLDDLVALAQKQNLPSRAVAVTSDDGYANIATTAHPILARHCVSATLFALSAPLADGSEFWWDRLAATILTPGMLPDELRLDIAGDTHHIDIGPATDYSATQWKADHCYRDGDEPGPRMALYLQLWRILLPAAHASRLHVLDALAQWAGIDAAPRHSHRSLTADELAALDGDVISVGGHTLTHPLLPDLPRRQQRREISDNKRELESILNRQIETFSYPFGGHDNNTVAAVRSAGYRVAVTTRPTPVTERSDPLRIPRFDIKNWSGGDFARHLQGWFRT
jgi:peptidoglycan/xylan/chitin deacetylase (PgdA/CDA1 family)